MVIHSTEMVKEADIILEYGDHEFHKRDKKNKMPRAEIEIDLQEWEQEDTDVISRFRKERREKEKKIYAIIAREKIIGSVELVFEKDIYQKNAQMRCWLLSAYHGKHIMSEAIWRICKKVFRETELTRIYVEPCTKDSAFRRVLEKNGFELEGILKNRIYQDGKYQDACMYAKLKKDE